MSSSSGRSNSPATLTADGIRLRVRLSPKASREAISGIERDAGQEPWLKVRVTAPPEKGKANRALLKLLAKALGIAQSRMAIVAGEGERRKTVLVRGGDETLLAAVEALSAGE